MHGFHQAVLYRIPAPDLESHFIARTSKDSKLELKTIYIHVNPRHRAHSTCSGWSQHLYYIFVDLKFTYIYTFDVFGTVKRLHPQVLKARLSQHPHPIVRLGLHLRAHSIET